MSSLEFSAVTVRYGKREVVRPFTRPVTSGGWLGLIGPNGAGKSSLLRAAVGLVPHDGDDPRRRRLDVVEVTVAAGGIAGVRATEPAAPARHDRLRVRVARAGAVRRLLRHRVRATTGRWRATCSAGSTLAEFADRRLGELSGGEQQRLVIARALATEAPILLLDEPTSALDIGHQQQALELVARLRRDHGLTVISAMHDLTLAGMYADHLALMHEGSVVAYGTAPRCCGRRRWPSSTECA